MDNNSPLTSALIAEPQMWRLAIEISNTSMHVAVTSTVADQSLICRSIQFLPEASSLTAAVENVVYDNPLLLGEFRTTDILIDTPRFMLIPTAFKSDANEIAKEFWGSDSDYTLIENEIPHTDATVLTSVDAGLINFLNRTFPEARITNRMVPLCRFFVANNRMGNSDKLYVNQRADSIDVMAFDGNRLLAANTFPAATVADKVYYTLLAADTIGLSRLEGRIFISGERALLNELLAELRKYITYVMPLIIPADIVRHGKQIHSIPFELAIQPLCE